MVKYSTIQITAVKEEFTLTKLNEYSLSHGVCCFSLPKIIGLFRLGPAKLEEKVNTVLHYAIFKIYTIFQVF